MNTQELNKILELHKLWLEGNEKGQKANLSGADLREANLREADLSGANLSGADLSEANLSGADLSFTCVVGFQLCKYFGFRHGNYVKIGCEGHTLDYWLLNYKEIGKQHNYSLDEIALVGDFLKLMNKYDL